MWTRLRRIWTAPVVEDETQMQAAQLLNIVLWVFLVTSGGILVFDLLFFGLPTTPAEGFMEIAAAAMLISSIAGLIFLHRRGRVRLTSVLLLLLMWSLTTFWMSARVGITADSSILTLAVIIILAGLLLGGRGAMTFTFLSGATVLTAYIFQEMGWLVPSSFPLTMMNPVLILIHLGLIGMLIHRAMNNMLDAMRESQRNAQIQSQINRELETLRATLEQRIAERTRDLERRTNQLQAAAEVGRVAASILDVDRLLAEVMQLLHDRFDLYHVAFLEVDSSGQWAEYRAGAGPGWQRLQQERFRLQVGGLSLIGWCIANAQVGVNQDVRATESIHFPHPLVPDTRSEVALPLIVRGQVIGALSVQSDKPHAFDRETIDVLRTIADQIAVALDNARLLRESQEALESARHAYGELGRQTWSDLLLSRENWGYRYTYRIISPVEGDWPPEMIEALETGRPVRRRIKGDSALAIPLQVRDQIVGVISFYKPADEAWTQDEINFLERAIQQTGVALESAQFYEESQLRAAQERIAREITARMRETLDIDTVLRTSLQEIRQALGLASMTIRLIKPSGEQN